MMDKTILGGLLMAIALSLSAYANENGGDQEAQPIVILKSKINRGLASLQVKAKVQDASAQNVQLFDSYSGELLAEDTLSGRHVTFNIPTGDLTGIPCNVEVRTEQHSAVAVVKKAKDCGVYSRTISGRVTDNPIAYAAVTAEVDGQIFTTVADVDGYYSLQVQGSNLSSIVTLSASGVSPDGTDIIEFFSLESFGAVSTENITNVTTALYSMVVKGNNGQVPATTAELEAAQTTVDATAVLNLAALIKIIVDEPGYDLPAGVSVIDFITDDALVDDFYETVQANDPTIFDRVVEQVLADSDLTEGYVAGELNGRFVIVAAANPGYMARSGSVYVFDEALGEAQQLSMDFQGIPADSRFLVEIIEGTAQLSLAEPKYITAFSFDIDFFYNSDCSVGNVGCENDAQSVQTYQEDGGVENGFSVEYEEIQQRFVRTNKGASIDTIVIESVRNFSIDAFTTLQGRTIPARQGQVVIRSSGLARTEASNSQPGFIADCNSDTMCLDGLWAGVFSYSPGVRSYDGYEFLSTSYGEALTFDAGNRMVTGVVSGITRGWEVNANGQLVITYADGTVQTSTPLDSQGFEVGVLSVFTGGPNGDFASYDIWVKGDNDLELTSAYLNSAPNSYWNGEVNAWIPGLLDDAGLPVPGQRFGWNFNGSSLSNYSMNFDYSSGTEEPYFIETLTFGWSPVYLSAGQEVAEAAGGQDGIVIRRYSYANRYWVPINSLVTANGERQFYVLEFERRDAEAWFGGYPGEGFREFIAPRVNIQREIPTFDDWASSEVIGPF